MIHLDHIGHSLASHIQQTLENKTKISGLQQFTKNYKRYIFWLDGMCPSMLIDPTEKTVRTYLGSTECALQSIQRDQN